MSTSMNIGPVLGRNDTIVKRSFRWLLEVGYGASDGKGINGVIGNSVNVLPPLSSSRPSLSFKEVELEHVSETIYMPTKAQWQPIKVKAYDVASNLQNNLVFDWVVRYYNSQKASYKFITDNFTPNFKKNAAISLYDGVGCCIESWTLENCYPKNIEWGELSMDNNSFVTIDMELRYDRAYVSVFNENGNITTAGRGCLDYGTGVRCVNGREQT
jgi:hypothetical protein